MTGRKGLFNHLKALKDETRLAELAEAEGFESVQLMIADLYLVQRVPFKLLAENLRLTEAVLRKRMVGWGITLRPKGGPNNLRAVVTDDVIIECRRDGVMVVSQRIGVHPVTLYLAITAWSTKKKEEEKCLLDGQ